MMEVSSASPHLLNYGATAVAKWTVFLSLVHQPQWVAHPIDVHQYGYLKGLNILQTRA